MNGIVDFHSHVLPEIDDGSDSVEMSLAMLRMQAEQGIGHVVATPHFYPRQDDPERFLIRRKKSEARLREEMEKHLQMPQLSVGAEVCFFSGISHCDALECLTINEKKFILIEMPACNWTRTMYHELEGIWERQGLIPIIAHIDRYISPLRTRGIPEMLANLPVVVQANASFFLDGRTRRLAMKLLRENKIQLLGSDCHNLTSRPPRLGAALERIQKQLGQEAIQQILSCQDAILSEQ